MSAITPDLLVAAMGCRRQDAERFAEPLAAAMAFYGITTGSRVAAFLAQIGHESDALRYTAELWGPSPAQRRYEGRADLGNTQPGDGERFKGHGLIQTTGRYNHARVRDRLRERFPKLEVPDFEILPELLCEPQWAALSAADYWDVRGLNALADAGDFVGITRKINGGTNGLADRQARWERAKAALIPHHQPTADRPAAAPPATTAAVTVPAKEHTMAFPIVSFLGGLAGTLIDVFSPLAREKVRKEMARHTDNPTVAEQIAVGVVEAAKAATGRSDAIDAVAAAKADAEIVQQVETSALETLDRLAPMLDKMAGWEREAWAAEESSRTAAADRGRADHDDMAPKLVDRAFVVYMTVFCATLSLMAAQMYFAADHKAAGELVGFFIAVATLGARQWEKLFEYRFGSSRSSGAKDVVIGELARRPAPGARV